MDLFKEVVMLITWKFREVFPQLSDEDIAAVIGNLAHECGGFKIMQEIEPVVRGSAGGYGWAQWTGPRRRAYFAWAKQQGLDVSSHDANLGFLLFELKTSEAGAIPRTRKAKGLKDKVVAFELGYERAGVKHYPSRLKWAEKALAAMPRRAASMPKEVEELIPPPPKPLTQSKTIWSTIVSYATGVGGSVLAAVNGMDWKVLLVLIVAGTLAGLVIYERVKKG